MTVSTLVFWGSWALVLQNVDPNAAGFVGLFIFYVSLLFALVGTFMLFGVGVRSLRHRAWPVFRHLGISLRQGILFAVLLVGALYLQGNGLFTWWNMVFFILGLALLEFFFLVRAQSKVRS
jgi:hypothetical protein